MNAFHRILFWALYGGSALFGGTASGQAPVTSPEMMRRMGLPFCSLSAGPVSGTFVVDTGADFTVVFAGNELLKNPHGSWEVSTWPHQLQLISGRVPCKRISKIPISVFGEPESTGALLVIEQISLEGVKHPAGFDGAVGIAQLRELSVQINLRSMQCDCAVDQFSPGEDWSSLVLAPNPFKRVLADVQLPPNHRTIPLTIDTGAVYPFQLTKPLIENLTRAGVLKDIGIRTIRGVGNRQVRHYILRCVHVAGREFVDVPVIESSAFAVGMGILSHFDIVLDFPGKKVWLKPLSDEWPKRVPPDASGLLLAYMDSNDLKIDVVEEGSSAAKAGLLVEDRILVCDGKEPKDWSMLDLRERLSQGGTKLPLRIRRGEKEFDLILPLEWQFEYPPKWPPRDQQIEEFEKFLKEQREKEKAGSKP